jgi:hypothetical protein
MALLGALAVGGGFLIEAPDAANLLPAASTSTDNFVQTDRSALRPPTPKRG